MRVASIREHATIMHHGEKLAGIMVQVSKKTKADPILFSAQAKDMARAAVEEVGDDEVGEFLGIATQDEGVGVYRFGSRVPGYRGWEWVVVLVTVPGSGVLTINEVSLQAGEQASLAPEWVPYEDRVQPGDLGPGDTLDVKLTVIEQKLRRIGGGTGRLAAVGAGTLLGAFVGSGIGGSLDRADEAYARQAAAHAYSAPVGMPVQWSNPQTGNMGAIRTTRDGWSTSGAYCREFQQQVVVGGRVQSAFGQACQQPDGTWRIVG